MAIGDKNLNVRIRATDETGPGLTSAQRRFEGLAGAALRMAPLVGVALGSAYLKSATDAWIRQEQAIAQVEARLRSTGGIAGWNSEQLQSMASSLQNVSTFGDEAILEMQSMLLTFTNVRGEVFEETSEAVLNLSVAMDQGLRTSVLQVGKALNDPIKGVTALAEAGIQFSAQQKEQIKTLVESGRVMDAQRVILRELETQFGGAATAARDTLGGALTAAQNASGDLAESAGKLLAPAIISAANAATELANALRKAFDPTLEESIERTRAQIHQITDQMTGRDRMPEGMRWLYGDLEGDLEAAEKKLAELQGRMAGSSVGVVVPPSVVGTSGSATSAAAAEDAADKARFDLRMEKMKAENDARIFLERQRVVELGRIKTEEDAADQLSFDNRMMRMQAENEQREFLTQANIDRIYREREEEAILAEQKHQLWTDSAGAFSDITNAIYTMGGRQSRKLFELNKVAGIANAIVNTASAATKALDAPPGPPVSFAYVAATIASGMAQVAAIQSTSFGGGGKPAPAGGFGGGTPTSPIVTQPGQSRQLQAPQELTIRLIGGVTDAYVEDEIIPRINSANTRGVTVKVVRE